MKDFLWCEKYRPQTLDDVILPKNLKEGFKNMVAGGGIPNMLLVGPKGSGKTTVALALVGALGAEGLKIDGTKDGDVETLRSKVAPFAMTGSLDGGRKYVIIDEADYLTWKTQPALRSFMEEHSKNCGFILTANYQNRIIPPLQSRCPPIDFTLTKEDRPRMMLEFFRRAKLILDMEKVDYDKEALQSFVVKYFPDFRRTLNELQRYAGSFGKIDQSILVQQDSSFDDLIAFLKDKDITKTRQWIAENVDNDPWTWFNLFYERCADSFELSFIPELVVLLADYQEKATRVNNQEINMAAFLLNVMVNAVYKK